jgi:uncharacterized Zn finger protein (UPF0148 family)
MSLMEQTDAQSGPVNCPECGGPLAKWPKIDGEGHVYLCSGCNQEVSPSVPLESAPPAESEESPSRFRKLLKEVEEAESEELPPSLLEDLPEETRSLLTASQLDRPTQKSKTGELREDLAQELRHQGYAIQEDAHGIRIGGGLPGRGSAAGMSPYDVIRMASDLEGGLPSPDELKRCPKCEAVVPPGGTRCQWCETTIEDSQTDSE